MNELEKLLNGNPSARASLDEMIAAATKTAIEGSKKEFEEKAKYIANIVGSENYSKPMKAMALKALTGEIEISSLKGAIIFADAQLEEKKSAQAKKEGKEQPQTPAEGAAAQVSETGEAKTEEEFQALIAQEKARREGR